MKWVCASEPSFASRPLTLRGKLPSARSRCQCLSLAMVCHFTHACLHRSVTPFVMPGLDPGIHTVTSQQDEAPMEWIAGSSPAMTKRARFSPPLDDALLAEVRLAPLLHVEMEMVLVRLVGVRAEHGAEMAACVLEQERDEFALGIRRGLGCDRRRRRRVGVGLGRRGGVLAA